MLSRTKRCDCVWNRTIQLDIPYFPSRKYYITDADKMEFVIWLSKKNIDKEGGPFGAAIFDSSNRLIAYGVNRVVKDACSVCHAEMMALMNTQTCIKKYNLDGYTLATSSQPCIMCFGGIYWSGVSRLLYGATKDDVETILGFDEGPVPINWKQDLENVGCQVEGPILREEAVKVLKLYDGIIY